MTFYVYRCFDADGVLLYIGKTKNPTSRFANHRSQRPWWDEVRRITLEIHTAAHRARLAEGLAITREHPAYNIKPAEPTVRSTRWGIIYPARYRDLRPGMFAEFRLAAGNPTTIAARVRRVDPETIDLEYGPIVWRIPLIRIIRWRELR